MRYLRKIGFVASFEHTGKYLAPVPGSLIGSNSIPGARGGRRLSYLGPSAVT